MIFFCVFVYKSLPEMDRVHTPILFLQEFKGIPNAVLKILGFPSVSYSDTETYSLNKIITYTFGFNIFQVIGIFGLAFLASVVLVTILLPNIYFRIMLFTDQSLQGKKLNVEPIIHVYKYEEKNKER